MQRALLQRLRKRLAAGKQMFLPDVFVEAGQRRRAASGWATGSRLNRSIAGRITSIAAARQAGRREKRMPNADHSAMTSVPFGNLEGEQVGLERLIHLHPMKRILVR